MNNGVIYCISNNVNEKIYIGSSLNYKRRKSDHIALLKKNKHHCAPLQNFVNKYGIDSINFTVLEKGIKECEIINKEQYYLDKYDKLLFNCLKTAYSNNGYRFTDEQKAYMKEVCGSNEERIKKSQRSKSFWERLKLNLVEHITTLNAKKVCQYDMLGNFVSEYTSGAEAARITGYPSRSIRKMCNGETKTIKDCPYIFKFKK